VNEPKPLKQSWRESSEPLAALVTLAAALAVCSRSALGAYLISTVYGAYVWCRTIQKVNRGDCRSD